MTGTGHVINLLDDDEPEHGGSGHGGHGSGDGIGGGGHTSSGLEELKHSLLNKKDEILNDEQYEQMRKQELDPTHQYKQRNKY